MARNDRLTPGSASSTAARIAPPLTCEASPLGCESVLAWEVLPLAGGGVAALAGGVTTVSGTSGIGIARTGGPAVAHQAGALGSNGSPTSREASP